MPWRRLPPIAFAAACFRLELAGKPTARAAYKRYVPLTR
jgi:hypothetical protein